VTLSCHDQPNYGRSTLSKRRISSFFSGALRQVNVKRSVTVYISPSVTRVSSA